MNSQQVEEAVVKNKQGLCSYPHCRNPLSDPQVYGTMGLCVCKDCDDKATQLVMGLKETSLQSWSRMLKSLVAMSEAPKLTEEETKDE